MAPSARTAWRQRAVEGSLSLVEHHPSGGDREVSRGSNPAPSVAPPLLTELIGASPEREAVVRVASNAVDRGWRSDSFGLAADATDAGTPRESLPFPSGGRPRAQSGGRGGRRGGVIRCFQRVRRVYSLQYYPCNADRRLLPHAAVRPWSRSKDELTWPSRAMQRPDDEVSAPQDRSCPPQRCDRYRARESSMVPSLDGSVLAARASPGGAGERSGRASKEAPSVTDYLAGLGG